VCEKLICVLFTLSTQISQSICNSARRRGSRVNVRVASPSRLPTCSHPFSCKILRSICNYTLTSRSICDYTVHTTVLTTRQPCQRTGGTTVTIANLFKPLPVRHKTFLRHLKREYAKMLAVVQAYAIIATGVRVTCANAGAAKG
jgi:hypothetical protein